MALKTAHWTLVSEAGSYWVAKSLVKTEKKLGIDSNLCNYETPEKHLDMYDADIHVIHSHLPDIIKIKNTKPLKTVWIGHGSPEHILQNSMLVFLYFFCVNVFNA